MTFGSLFSGIGGLDKGLEDAGMTCLWQSEIDPFCCRVLKRRWPSIPNLGDITQIVPLNLSVDLVCGGFPCQPHSVAGRRLGKLDSRYLVNDTLRILKGVKPTFILLENVRGLLSSNNGETFKEILNELHTLGYDAEWTIISARNFGAPHKRERLFILAYPIGTRLSGYLLQESRLCSTTSQASTEFGNKIISCGGQWINPEYLRMGNGISTRLDRGRVKALGNAVVPAVAKAIGLKLMEFTTH